MITRDEVREILEEIIKEQSQKDKTEYTIESDSETVSYKNGENQF